MDSTTLFDPYTLRPIHPDDAQGIFDSIDTQREHLGRWLPFVASTLHVGQTQQVVAKMLADTENPVFTLRAEGVFAGLIGFKSADPMHHTIEIGYWLREEHQGRGVMTAAVRALCEQAFSTMDMMCIEIRCATGNLPSNAIPRRLDFRLDRIELRGEQLSNGEWVDLNVYILNKTKMQWGVCKK